jgi:hypothetical protein
MTPENLVRKIRTLVNTYPEGGIARLLLHKADLAVLSQCPEFDSEMKNSEFNIRGHLWGIAVGEPGYTRSGIIGVELMPDNLQDIAETEVKPWYEAAYDTTSSKSIDIVLDRFDNLLTWGLVDKALKEYSALDLKRLDGGALCAILTALHPRSDVLPWERIYKEVAQAFLDKGVDRRGAAYTPESVDRMLQGLKEPRKGQTVTEFAAAIQGKTVVIPN